MKQKPTRRSHYSDGLRIYYLDWGGNSKKQMQVQLVQFATLFENGSKVKMSTRSGNFYTLKQLIDDIGISVLRNTDGETKKILEEIEFKTKEKQLS